MPRSDSSAKQDINQLVDIARGVDALALLRWSGHAYGGHKMTGGGGGSSPATLLAVLSKFEEPDHIHVLATRTSLEAGVGHVGGIEAVVEFPRFDHTYRLHSDGSVLSNDFAGCCLARQQQLPGLLRGFEQYLVLESTPGPAASSSRNALRLVIPEGVVPGDWQGHDSGRNLTVKPTPTATGQLQHIVATLHPRFAELRARSVAARLQLAALHMATTSLLSEPLTGVTGAEAAAELLKSCVVDRPLDADEFSEDAAQSATGVRVAVGGGLELLNLRSTSMLAWRNPSVALLCAYVERASHAVAFLYPQAADVGIGPAVPHARLRDAQVAYRTSKRLLASPPLLLLSGEEERVVLGAPVAEFDLVGMLPQPTAPALPPLPTLSTFVADIEYDMAGWVSSVQPGKGVQAPSCPVSVTSVRQPGTLELERYAELSESWDAHQQTSTMTLVDGAHSAALRAFFARHYPDKLSNVPRLWDKRGEELWLLLRKKCSDAVVDAHCPPAAAADDCRLGDVIDHLLQRVHEWTAGVSAQLAMTKLYFDNAAALAPCDPTSPLARQASAWQVLRAAGAVRAPRLADWVRSMWHGVGAWNPFLAASPDDTRTLRSGVVRWLELSVLQDKLHRLAALLQRREPSCLSDAVRELQTKRVWEADSHPAWLAFEADRGIQIRPLQYAVAAALLADPGLVLQLNVGEGKTRVIVPMLALEWTLGASVSTDAAGPSGAPIIRLVVLPQLRREAFDYLQDSLSAGVLRRRLFSVPFSRDVHVDAARLRDLHAHAAVCHQSGGVMVVTREARSSLLLKAAEIELRSFPCCLCGDPRHDALACSCPPTVADGSCAASGSPLARSLERYEALPWQDVFDESDELLSFTYQLVYGVGSEPPPDLPQRCAAIDALLCALQVRRGTKAASYSMCLTPHPPTPPRRVTCVPF